MTRPVPDGRTTKAEFGLLSPTTLATPGSGLSSRDGEGEARGAMEGVVRGHGSGGREGSREGGDGKRVCIDLGPRGVKCTGTLQIDVTTKPTPESGPFIKSGGFFGKLCFSISISPNHVYLVEIRA